MISDVASSVNFENQIDSTNNYSDSFQNFCNRSSFIEISTRIDRVIAASEFESKAEYWFAASFRAGNQNTRK